MDFSKLVKTRQSVRKYDGRPIGREVLDECAEAARLAPSACNSQPWKFILVDDSGLVRKVAGCTYGGLINFNRFTDDASAFAVVVMEPGNFTSMAGARLKKMDYAFIDMGIAVENFCLQAADLGVGTCIIGWSRQKPLRKLLGIPMNKKIGLLIAIGYEKDPVTRKKIRKPLESMRSYNEFKE